MLYILLSIGGAFALYCIVHLVIPRSFPRPPKELLERLREVHRATETGDWHDDSDLFVLDEAMMKAEMEKPGSTLLMYFGRLELKVASAMGSAFVSFIINGWILGIFSLSFPTILGLVLGVSLLFGPFLYWELSRPQASLK